jgi:hypothetical protein
VDDFLKFNEREGVEPESRLLLERFTPLILEGYVLEADFSIRDFTSLEETSPLRSEEDAAFVRDKELLLEG